MMKKFGVNFSDFAESMEAGVSDFDAPTETMQAATINYGNFLQTLIDFIIIAFCVFMLVKFINKLARKQKKEEDNKPAPAPQPSAEEKLLTEIRDLLKDKQ